MKRFQIFLLLLLAPAYVSATTVSVLAGEDFQAALDAAKPGDTLVLQAGASFPTAGGFVLKNKAASKQIITIQSSDLTSLPAASYRVHPADASLMPKLVSTVDGSPVLSAVAGAHHYQFIGIEMTVAPDHSSNALIEMGKGNETDVALLPHHILFDRCYIHGDPKAQPGTKRGVQMNGISIDVFNSYISDIHAVGQESQAIAGWNGPGPFKIVNNRLEASTQNLLFGGAAPTIPTLVPSDIEIRNNYMTKPFSWMKGHPAYARIPWTVKNILELMNAQRVLIESNLFENNWQDAQNGFAILFTPRAQGNAPWTVVKDVQFVRNIVRNTASGIQVRAGDDQFVSQPTQNILIQDNLIYNVCPTEYGGDGRLFQFQTPAQTASGISVIHNSAFHNGFGNSAVTTGDCCTISDPFIFSNNLMTRGTSGFFGGSVGEGTPALSRYYMTYRFEKNAFIGSDKTTRYPTGTFFPSDINAVNFMDFSGNDFRLTLKSPYKGAGTDGKDLGADIEVVLRATCGAAKGVPAFTCSGGPIPPLGPLPNTALSEQPAMGISDLSSVRVLPNPWRADLHKGTPRIMFENLVSNCEIRILTTSGQEVKSIVSPTHQAYWDLTNKSGKKVASGTYEYVITTKPGEKKKGRVEIIY